MKRNLQLGPVFITGASSGIGLALAQAFLNQRREVFGMSRKCPQKLVGEESFHFAAGDLGDAKAVEEQLGKLLKGTAGLDLVVLNAAILGRVADLKSISLEEAREAFEVNVWANKTILDTLDACGIRVQQVVAISSGAAVVAHRGFGLYSICKAALNMLVAVCAQERPEIHFSAIAPGMVDTPMQAQVRRLPQDARFPVVETLKRAQSTGLMATPEEAAAKLMKRFEEALKYPSGSFLEV